MEIKESITEEEPAIVSIDLKEYWMEWLLTWNLYSLTFGDEIT